MWKLRSTYSTINVWAVERRMSVSVFQDGVVSPETDSGFVGSESSRPTPSAAAGLLHRRAAERWQVQLWLFSHLPWSAHEAWSFSQLGFLTDRFLFSVFVGHLSFGSSGSHFLRMWTPCLLIQFWLLSLCRSAAWLRSPQLVPSLTQNIHGGPDRARGDAPSPAPLSAVKDGDRPELAAEPGSPAQRVSPLSCVPFFFCSLFSIFLSPQFSSYFNNS